MDRVFIDSSEFKALMDVKDEFHSQGVKVWLHLQSQNCQLITTNFVLDETFTLIRSKCGLPFAENLRSLLAKSSQAIEIVRVTVQDEADAWKWFIKDWSKLSFTDCVSFAVMKRLALRRVLTFDPHFSRAGFIVEKA